VTAMQVVVSCGLQNNILFQYLISDITKIIAIVNIPLNITCQTVKKGDLVLDTSMLLAFRTIVDTFCYIF
jgi:hypothetical protein